MSRVVILAIDTSHPVGSVTLRTGEGQTDTIEFDSPSSHLVELGAAASSLAARAGIEPARIDRVAVVSGPGSFTGLRISMAFAKGLHAAAGTAVVAMTGLELLAADVLENEGTVCTMIDARRAEVYAAVYQRDRGGGEAAAAVACVAPPQAVSPDAFLLSLGKRPMVFVGSGALRWREAIAQVMGESARVLDTPAKPSTELLARLAAKLEPVGASEVAALEPFYIRPSDAKLAPLGKVQTHE